MKIDFGMVNEYFTDKGFGFVGHTFFDTHPNKLFHIKTIKRTDPELARRLDNEDSTETVYFWYEFEESNKGGQVVAVLNLKSINQQYKADLRILIEETEYMWRDLNSKIPDRLNQISVDLMGVERANELSSVRAGLELRRENEKENKRRGLELRRENEKENKRREAETLRKKEDERIQQEIEDEEFKQLIAEMTPLGFTNSKQLSLYIMENSLGNKYKNISGVVKMEKEGEVWPFKGGFPPTMYAKICSKLGLGNAGSRARVVDFIPFKELNKKK
jgi:hypothetical protein